MIKNNLALARVVLILGALISTVVIFFVNIISCNQPKTLSSSDSNSMASITTASQHPFIEIEPNQCTSTNRGVFDKIYATNVWGGGLLRRPEEFYNEANWPPKEKIKISASGPGSNKGIQTVASLQALKEAIIKYNVKSMLDIPCGDVNWILDSFVTDTLPLYVGLDVASPVIEINKKRFEHHMNKHFTFWDATECTLPHFINGTTNKEEVFDLVHVRDVIQHLTLNQGLKYYCNVFLSGARILVTTSYKAKVNIDIQEGGYYDNNVFIEPFSFPEGDCFRHDRIAERRDFTCVFDLTSSDWKDYISNKC